MKKGLKIVKRYIIGLLSIYIIALIIGYIFLVKINNIKIKSIPESSLINQFEEKKSFKDYKGKVLLVDFWFVNCKPCLEEMKYFPQLLEKYKPNLAIMSINIDSKKVLKEILEKKPKPWDFLISDNENWTFYSENIKESGYVKDLKIKGFPTYLLFNKKGKLISSPISGLAAVENEMSGILGMNLSIEKNIKKIPKLIVPYTIFFLIILFIQYSIYSIKNKFNKN